jgi:D-glycero-alpha-D-manno-heptose-7-phosphate kinase
MSTIKARAPMRMSFAGGGTDVSPFCDEYGGAVLNSAISRHAYVTMSERDGGMFLKSFDYMPGVEYSESEGGRADILTATIKRYFRGKDGLEVSFFIDAPKRSGLGASASAFVSLLCAINRRENLGFTRKKIAEEAWRLEREELGNIGGKQDQYASAFGGLNYIEFRDGGVDVNPLRVDDRTALELESRVIIFYYKPREASGTVLEGQIENVRMKKKDTIDALIRSREIAREMKGCLLNGDIDGMGALLHEGWGEKRKFSSAISSPEIDLLYSKLLERGALGGKISGAGGGGFMFMLCGEGKTLDVYHYLNDAGMAPFFLNIDKRGAVAWE